MFAYTKLSETYTKSSKANGKCRILLLLICLPKFYHLLRIRSPTMASASSARGAAVKGRLRDDAVLNRQKTEAEVILGEHLYVKHAEWYDLWTDQSLNSLHWGTSQLPERLVLEHTLHSARDAWPWQPSKQTNKPGCNPHKDVVHVTTKLRKRQTAANDLKEIIGKIHLIITERPKYQREMCHIRRTFTISLFSSDSCKYLTLKMKDLWQ